MKRRIFVFDGARCFGCHGCVAACANANRTPPGLLWRLLLKLPPEEGGRRTVYLSLSCNHCLAPPCAAACPSRALEKRPSDGVVIHHESKCIGCQYCRAACPYDAIRWEEEGGVVSKCHFCHERLEEGREPACVETCFAGALSQEVIDPDEEAERFERDASGLIHLPEVGPNIRFVPHEGEGKR